MARRKDPAQKVATKRQQFVERTAQALQITPEQAATLLRTARHQSVRINPLAAHSAQTLTALRQLGWQGQQYPWTPDGYTITAGLQAVRDSPLITEGRVYIQNAASWIPVLALNPQPDEHILDVCAAPGGKTTHIAALTNNHACITANDNSRARLAKLRATCQRLQANIDHYTLFDAQFLARKLHGQQFDKILLDAPCSGEGLMHLNADAGFTTWSVAHIKRLQQLQKRIIVQAWQLLTPGGTLVYSTCTMAPEENEAVIDYALRTLENAQIVPIGIPIPNRAPAVTTWNGKPFNPHVQQCLRLYPSPTIEAFFVCVVRKTG